MHRYNQRQFRRAPIGEHQSFGAPRFLSRTAFLACVGLFAAGSAFAGKGGTKGPTSDNASKGYGNAFGHCGLSLSAY